MKSLRYFQFFILIGFALLAFSSVSAQGTPDEPTANTAKQPDFRANALKQLGLTREQVMRIRRLNQERKPRMDAAQMRLRRANRALDDAIYSDTATDAEIEERLKEFQAAQADVARVRFIGELGVRRILTPEQLMRFRVMRQRFEQNRASSDLLPSSRTPAVAPAVNRTAVPQVVRSDTKKP